jgi:hypothetical protein
MAITSQNKVSGIIALYKKETEFGNRFVINAMSRLAVLDTLTGDPWQKAAYARWMTRYDKNIFNSSDAVLNDTYCKQKLRVPPHTGGSGDGGGNGLGGPNNPPTLCNWRVLNICGDDETQQNWVAGTIVLPPHLDHDQDGGLNYLDPDWITFSTQNNLTQE